MTQGEFDVSDQEIAAGRVDRTLDCSADFGGDGIGSLEMFAEAEVVKGGCGFGCFFARPETSVLSIDKVEDDDAEDDDVAANAAEARIGLTTGRINRDQDWHSVTIDTASRIDFAVRHRAAAGRLDVVLFDADNRQVTVGQDVDDAAIIAFEPALPGTYRLRVSPRQDGNFNFYDTELDVTPVVVAECESDATESQACGRCGTQARTCSAESQWGPFGECADEGACSPGETRSRPCGLCGSNQETCRDVCEWIAGECENQGVCVPGETESETCVDEGGERSRRCNLDCFWDPHGACEGGECMAGDTRGCYTGPEGTEGVGVCAAGRQNCGEGLWAPCVDDVLPSEEVCDDGLDNNCNDATDGDDAACETGICDDGAMRSCYSGPEGTEGVGTCRAGAQNCLGGAWEGCEGAVAPRPEDCGDGFDNDCDGDVDGNDRDCVMGPAVGDPCSDDASCGDGFDCILAPDHPMFSDGYCGVLDCRSTCGPGTACVFTFGARLCLATCDRIDDCRDGYLCAAAGDSPAVCLPRCEDDADCREPARPVCDVAGGECVPMPVGPMGGGGSGAGGGAGGGGMAPGTGGGFGPPPSSPDAGGMPPLPVDFGDDDTDNGGGCQCELRGGTAPGWAWALLAAAFAMRLRRRR